MRLRNQSASRQLLFLGRYGVRVPHRRLLAERETNETLPDCQHLSTVLTHGPENGKFSFSAFRAQQTHTTIGQ